MPVDVEEDLELKRRRHFFMRARNPLLSARSQKRPVDQSLIMPFWRYVEATANIQLDRWQLHVCNRLEKLKWQRGQRLMIAAGPQLGKSIILSQRLPPYLLGHLPDYRLKLACYNIKRATRHTRIAKQVICSTYHQEHFPDPSGHVNPLSPDAEWSTAARIAKMDGQPSFHALGLETGLVGDGPDMIFIDDPYSSPDDARSKAINDKICNFWPETVKPRIDEDANVVVMFHRYTENDLGGKLLAEGGWEYLRYAAIADGDYEHPTTGERWPDPLGRRPGEKLTERKSDNWYNENRRNEYVWLSQFQGRPTAREGSFFKVGLLTKDHYIDRNELPASLKRFTRGWDLAATDNGGDYTVGVLVAGPDENGFFYVVDMVRGQWGPDDVTRNLRQAAGLDKLLRPGIHQRLPQDPAQAGKWQAKALIKLLAGHRVSALPISGDKQTNAFDVSSQFNAGNVKLVKGPWNRDFIEELRTFPNGANDDIVDAFASAFNDLCGRKTWSTA